MKKTLAMMTAAMMVAGALAGCGSSSSTPVATTAEATTAAATEAATTEVATTEAGDTAAAAEGTVKTPSGKFTVGFDQEFPPMGFVGDDGQFTGFDLDLAKEVASRLGLEFVPQPINWDAKDMELDSGNIDCIWNGFTMQGREDAYTWVGPYMANNQVFVVTADSDITSKADLAGKAVEVQKFSTALASLHGDAEHCASIGSMTDVAD